jgi:hypothetical protein
MIGSQTEPVCVPFYEIVAAALFRVATPFFVLTYAGGVADMRSYARWEFLRSIASFLLISRDLRLDFLQRQTLTDVLRFCERSPDVEFLKSVEFAHRDCSVHLRKDEA